MKMFFGFSFCVCCIKEQQSHKVKCNVEQLLNIIDKQGQIPLINPLKSTRKTWGSTHLGREEVEAKSACVSLWRPLNVNG